MTQEFGIKGFITTSMVDWPGKICSVVFLAGCGFRCPACHNRRLVVEPETIPNYPIEKVLDSLHCRKDWIDGVTVTGGEPTTRKNLPDLLRLFRDLGIKIKLDTNGSNPAMLVDLVRSRLVDAVFMDVKAPLDKRAYAGVAGVSVDVRLIRRSIEILKSSSLEVAFRTTAIPGLVEEPELDAIRRALGDVQRFMVQAFQNRDTLDKQFGRKVLFDQGRIDEMRRCFEVPARVPPMMGGYACAG
ncbi:MAG: anaerobic ribonucleoside-triphosphate reductase activating protein [Desulfomonile tiedjei]|nr:anaerobic ribonucleoside-triphosphate reductase activating protein [Desulfomonile tiedjei]